MHLMRKFNGLFPFSILLSSFILNGCTGLPDNLQPVNEFDIQRYLGTWYEIARLDHSFERGLDNISAEYTLRDDGGVQVINKGFSKAEEKWSRAEGRAYFVGREDVGHLKVSFFGPFYGTYAIFELDKEDYQHAFISGPDTSYLWLLSRTPTVDKGLIKQFINKSKSLGFNTDELIFVNHNLEGT